MFAILSRRLSSRSALFSCPTALQTASLVVPRKNRAIAEATEPTHDDTDIGDRAQTASSIGMDKITRILDNAALSKPPQSNNFSGKLLVVFASQLPKTQCSS
jgi:hypothetical protein